MRRVFFYYQQLQTGAWSPVLKYDEPPVMKDGYEVSSNGKLQPATRLVELTEDDFILTEPEQFGELQRRYPRK